MFSKLLKYEMKATGKVQAILCGASLGISALICGILYLVRLRLVLQPDVLGIVSMALLPIPVLALVGCAIAAWLLLYYHFYKHKFTDEGYLTFTLPVSTGELIWSSFLNILIWTTVSGLVLGLSVLLLVTGIIGAVMPGQHTLAEMLRDIWQIFRTELMGAPQLRLYWGLSVFAGIISSLAGILSTMAAIVLGAAAAKKHKLLAAFGIAYGLSIVVGTLQSSMTMGLTLGLDAAGRSLPLWAGPIFQIILYLALGIGSYLIISHIMGRKLNLS